jgi:uncharacterized protein (TIGR02118 family)
VSAASEAVKAIVAMKRSRGLTLKEFRRQLAGNESTVRAIPALRRHARSQTLDSGYRKKEPIYDAVDELWFDDEPAARRAITSAKFADALKAAGGEGPRSGVFLVRDHIAKNGEIPPDGVKSFEFVTRRADLTVEEFHRYWREVHGPIAVHIEVIRHYVQSHTVLSEYDDGHTPLWDGSAITWFDDLQAMRVSGASAELAATRADEENFLGAPLKLPFLIVTERELAV